MPCSTRKQQKETNIKIPPCRVCALLEGGTRKLHLRILLCNVCSVWWSMLSQCKIQGELWKDLKPACLEKLKDRYLGGEREGLCKKSRDLKWILMKFCRSCKPFLRLFEAYRDIYVTHEGSCSQTCGVGRCSVRRLVPMQFRYRRVTYTFKQEHSHCIKEHRYAFNFKDKT